MKKNFDAKIYKPYGATPHYRVVIGENLILKRARFLQKRAIAEASLKETTLWTFPED